MTELRTRWAGLRYRYELVALVAMVVATRLFPSPAPLGIVALGVVAGAAIALQAIGVLLVYRTGRFINFAQVQVGLFGAGLLAMMVNGAPLLRGADALCGCIGDPPGSKAYAVNFVLAIAVAFGGALLAGFVIYHVVVRRFANQPRLVLCIATIFAAQALAALEGGLAKRAVSTDQQDLGINPLGSSPPPFHLDFRIDTIRFHVDSVVVVVAAVLAVAGVSAYLRFSAVGTAIRAAAESPSRARTLGINVDGVNTRVWLIAAATSAVCAISFNFVNPVGAVGTGDNSPSPTATLGVTQLVVVLTATVIARFSSLAVAALASIVLAVLDQSMAWSYGSSATFRSLLVVILGALLLLQRRETGRVDVDDSAGWQATKELRPIPRELRSLAPVKKWRRIGGAVVLIVLGGLPFVLSPSKTALASSFAILVIVGLSLLLLTGWAGQISLGQFGFAAIGAWTVAVVHPPFPFGPLLAGVAGALAAVIVGVPALKLRGLYLAISSLAFAVSVSSFFIGDGYLGRKLPSTVSRPSVFGMSLEDERLFFYLVLLIVLACTAAVVGVRRSRVGRVLIAMRDNEPSAQSFGINLLRVRLGAFAFSGFLAALAGSLYAYDLHAVGADSFTPETSLNVFLFTVIGGLSGVAGPFIGFIYYGLLTVLADVPGIKEVGAGPVGLILLIALPGGLAQGVYAMRDTLLRRVAERFRIVVPSLVADRKARRDDGRAALLPRGRPGSVDEVVPTRYEPGGQWALARYGTDDPELERVGG
jgi:branched-chain amino acid transport system permease protein